MRLIKSNKAFMWPSHRPDVNKMGWIEFQEIFHRKKLWPIHRLDKETSGCFLMAEDKDSAALAEKEFRQQKVKKEYLFISKEAASFDEKSITTSINDNACQTDFVLLEKSQEVSLWKAFPKTGRKHQVRIHAKEAGIPLLGDSLYNNSSGQEDFFFLHCHKMEIANNKYFSEPNYVYKNLEVFNNLQLAKTLHHIERRLFLFADHSDCYCLFHHDTKGLRVEMFGHQVIYEIYEPSLWPESLIHQIHGHLEKILEQSLAYIFQYRKNRGQDPNTENLLYFKDAKAEWVGKENGLKFLMKADQGKSFGLFLDQKEHRKKIAENSKDKSFLNLFCYTGGFSVYAARAGAKEIVNVDTSKPSLHWLKENLRINNLDESLQEYWSSDARVYVKGCLKHNKTFDIIVCDPPSFARTKKNAFKIKQDLAELIKNLEKILKPKGTLYFSTNFEGWTHKDFQQNVTKNLNANKIEWTRSSYDFEPPNQETTLKGFYYKK